MIKGEMQPRRKPNERPVTEMTLQELQQVFGGQEQSNKRSSEEAAKRTFDIP